MAKNERQPLHPAATAYLAVGVPASAVSIPPLFAPSTQEHTHPLRTLDILGIPDFFDHSGNCLDSVAVGTILIVSAGALVQRYVPENKQRIATIGTAAIAAVGSVSVNVAYESNAVDVPFIESVPDDSFDSADVLFGSVSGTLLAAAYGIAAMRQKRRLRKEQHRH